MNRFSRDLGIVDEQLPIMGFDQVLVRTIYLQLKMNPLAHDRSSPEWTCMLECLGCGSYSFMVYDPTCNSTTGSDSHASNQVSANYSRPKKNRIDR